MNFQLPFQRETRQKWYEAETGQWTSGRGGSGMLSSESGRTGRRRERLKNVKRWSKTCGLSGTIDLTVATHLDRLYIVKGYLLTATAKPSCAALRCVEVGDNTASRHVLHTNKICATWHRLDRKCVVAGRSRTYGHQDLTPATSLIIKVHMWLTVR